MEIFVCKICQKKCNGLNGLRTHSSLLHKIDSETIYIDYILNGVKPKCKCGCGQETGFISITKGYSNLVQSHHNRLPGKNNYHKSPETHKKAITTQKQNWKLGKYKGWWENDTDETKEKIEGIKIKLRNDKERALKISNSLTGVQKSEETKKNISIKQIERFKNNPQLKIDASERRIKWLRRKLKTKKTILEKKFESILNLLNLKNDFQYEYHNRLFDFYLNNHNILIEVDGDFYHCNPEIYNNPIYESQRMTILNDKYKNELCNNNITLLRYWEKDINERPEWVINDLKSKLL